MDSLNMKYFVLKPSGGDAYAIASRHAMLRYATSIDTCNPKLAAQLRDWVLEEGNKAENSAGGTKGRT